MRAISAIAGSIVIVGALGVAVAQSAAVTEANKPLPKPGVQEMTASQMLTYMKEQGTKYIVETTDIPKDRKFEVNFGSSKPDEIAKAVAKALDLKATKEGDVWVLKNQEFARGFNGMDFDFEMPDVDFDMPQFDDGMFRHFDGKEWDQMSPEEKAKFEKAMAEFGEQMKNFKIEMKGFDGKAFKFDDEAFRKFKGKDFDKMTPAEKAEFDKEMEKLQKELKNMKVEINGMDSEEFKKDMERMKEEIKASTKEGMRVHIENTDKLLGTITDKQWETMKSQGHLKLSDLTPAQRELLGNPKGDGEFNITIQRDGKKLVIRN